MTNYFCTIFTYFRSISVHFHTAPAHGHTISALCHGILTHCHIIIRVLITATVLLRIITGQLLIAAVLLHRATDLLVGYIIPLRIITQLISMFWNYRYPHGALICAGYLLLCAAS